MLVGSCLWIIDTQNIMLYTLQQSVQLRLLRYKFQFIGCLNLWSCIVFCVCSTVENGALGPQSLQTWACWFLDFSWFSLFIMKWISNPLRSKELSVAIHNQSDLGVVWFWVSESLGECSYGYIFLMHFNGCYTYLMRLNEISLEKCEYMISCVL